MALLAGALAPLALAFVYCIKVFGPFQADVSPGIYIAAALAAIPPSMSALAFFGRAGRTSTFIVMAVDFALAVLVFALTELSIGFGAG